MGFDDGPTPRMDGLALVSDVDAAGPTDIQAIFDTRVDLEQGRWDGVIIHHSGSQYGSPALIAAEHQSRNLHGLGHHFVIGNGNGADDGELHVGYRWLDQLPGAHTGGPNEGAFNRRYVGVCLVGDGDQRSFTDGQLRRLGRLIEALTRELDIPADQVLLHRDVAQTSSPGRLFPEAWLRGQVAQQAETVAEVRLDDPRVD